MTFSGVGTVDIDLDNRLPAVFPTVTVQEGKGYLFLLQMLPVAVVLPLTYFTVVAVMDTARGEVEMPLDSKFFPKQRRLLVSVGVPTGELFKDIQLALEVEAKNRFGRRRDSGVVRLRCLFERDEEYDANAVPL